MAHPRRPRTVRQVSLLLIIAAVVVGGMPMSARAARGFDHSIGNGRHNRNSVSINSPSFDRGVQHANNTDIGHTITQFSFCKGRFRHCVLPQRAWIR